MNFKKMLILLGIMIVAGAILAACGGKAATPAATATPVATAPEMPFLANWQSSAHDNVSDEPFRHWDDTTANPNGVPTTCAKCHTSIGYQDFLGVDGSQAGTVDAAVPATQSQGITCVGCHNVGTLAETSVTFPSGAEITNLGVDARCMDCHQGRESKVSVDKTIAQFGDNVDPDKVPAPVKNDQGNDVSLSFINIHYYAAGATLYGSMVHGGYEYDGSLYDSKNTHVAGYDSCTGCHDPHTLKVKVEQCSACHKDVATVDDLKDIRMVSSAKDYDGDGNVTEGIYYEIQGLQELLLNQIQAYAKDTAGAEIQYDAETYPYFLGTDGKAYPSWTPRLLKAAYNYQVSMKDPGAFAHNPKYIIELLYDSIKDLGGDVSKLARDDAAHFAGDTEPFRHWDYNSDGSANFVVPFACVKCHTAQGLPTYLSDGGTMVVTSSGSTTLTGTAPLPSSNGYMCTTCHTNPAGGERISVASVTFPSGKTVSLSGKGADGTFVASDSNLCVSCHQGRESTVSVNNALKGKELDTVDSKISFKNVHYLAAGATLFGGDVQGAYQYDGKTYFGQNMHADPKGKMNKCTDCHDVHSLEPKLDSCSVCHDGTDPTTFRKSTVDYDGDGNITEGIKGEVDTLTEALYTELQTYATAHGGAIEYKGDAYPYFFGADGKAYTAWTPRLMRAAYNYQFVQKDPGAYVHNPKYIIQILIDSIQDLGGDVSKYTRPEVPTAQ